jgi:hypothetical protein
MSQLQAFDLYGFVRIAGMATVMAALMLAVFLFWGA